MTIEKAIEIIANEVINIQKLLVQLKLRIKKLEENK